MLLLLVTQKNDGILPFSLMMYFFEKFVVLGDLNGRMLKHPISVLNYASFGITVSDPTLVKAYMKSRFRSTKSHHIFVLIDKRETGRNAVVEYFCTCETGSRTVDCCSHVMTVIWYLGYGQYNEIHIPNPNRTNVSITIPKNQEL